MQETRCFRKTAHFICYTEQKCLSSPDWLSFVSLTPIIVFIKFERTLFSGRFVLSAATETPIEWNSDIIADRDSGALLANGIIFIHFTKILLAENYIHVDFLVPFPNFEMNVSAALGTYIS